MKKETLLTIILLITLMFYGCGKQTASVSSHNTSTAGTTVSNTSGSQQNTTSSMQNINNSMEKLDGALNNSDNSKDINYTEALINNIN